MPWYVLGFTGDDIVGGAQDERLGQACFAGWLAEGEPQTFDLRQAPGTGDHFIFWYLSKASAALLDRQHVDWRGFVIGRCQSVPPQAAPVFPPAPP